MAEVTLEQLFRAMAALTRLVVMMATRMGFTDGEISATLGDSAAGSSSGATGRAGRAPGHSGELHHWTEYDEENGRLTPRTPESDGSRWAPSTTSTAATPAAHATHRASARPTFLPPQGAAARGGDGAGRQGARRSTTTAPPEPSVPQPEPPRGPKVFTTAGNLNRREGRYHRYQDCHGLRSSRSALVEMWLSETPSFLTACLVCGPPARD